MTLKETKLYGLVLAGGKSKRMGHDKSIISWHGKEQRYYVADLLKPLCEEVYISCRSNQQNEIDSQYKTLPDRVDIAGPSAGILTALAKHEDAAWLVVACDLPLLDKETLQYLIDNRNKLKVATSYKSPHDGLPEPLIAIWEPASKEALLSFIETGHSCPRKALINSDTHIIEPQNPDALINANTPEDAERVQQILANKIKSA